MGRTASIVLVLVVVLVIDPLCSGSAHDTHTGRNKIDYEEEDDDDDDQRPTMTAYYFPAAACKVLANAFVPVLTHSTVPLAAGPWPAGKFNQPITTSLPRLSER